MLNYQAVHSIIRLYTWVFLCHFHTVLTAAFTFLSLTALVIVVWVLAQIPSDSEQFVNILEFLIWCLRPYTKAFAGAFAAFHRGSLKLTMLHSMDHAHWLWQNLSSFLRSGIPWILYLPKMARFSLRWWAVLLYGLDHWLVQVLEWTNYSKTNKTCK